MCVVWDTVTFPGTMCESIALNKMADSPFPTEEEICNVVALYIDQPQ